jgi:hypothetical protein
MKVLIEFSDLEQGGFKAQRVVVDGEGKLIPEGEEIYAERLPGKLGLIARIGKRLIEIFKPG